MPSACRAETVTRRGPSGWVAIASIALRSRLISAPARYGRGWRRHRAGRGQIGFDADMGLGRLGMDKMQGLAQQFGEVETGARAFVLADETAQRG